MSDEIIKFKSQLLASLEAELENFKRFDLLKADLTHVDIMSAPMYMRDFNSAYVLASKVVSSLKQKYEDAKLERDRAEAKAKLEGAPKYFEENQTLNKDVKDTPTLRNAYAAIDEDYLLAAQKVNALQALLMYFEALAKSYDMAFYTAKQIYTSTSGSSYGKTGYEGLPSGSNKKGE